MKLLMLSCNFPPPFEGGSLVYLYQLAANLPRGSLRVITNQSQGQVDFDVHQHFRIWRSWMRWGNPGKARQVGTFLLWMAGIPPRLPLWKPDLVLAGDIYLSGLVACCIKAVFGIPYVVFVYAEELSMQIVRQGGFRQRLRGWMCRTVLGSANGIVGVSDFTLSLLPALGIEAAKGIKIVPMVMSAPPEQSKLVATVKSRLGLGAGQQIVLSMVRLIERKGQDNLIRSFPRVMASVPDARLVIAGRGPDEARLKALVAELGLGHAVIFAGFVSDAEKPVFFDVCDVFAMPHRELPDGDTEGCPTVFLEAGAHGKPVVGGRTGGVRDAILDGQTGFIVDGESPEQIAEALVAILADRTLAARLGAQGRQRVLEDLSPAKGAQTLMTYSKTLLERKGIA